MSPMAVLKLLKEAKKVFDYVHKKNNLDMQMEMVLNRMDELEPPRYFSSYQELNKFRGGMNE